MSDDNGSKILDGDKIFLSKGHFDDLSLRELTKIISDLGGDVVTEQDDATVLLINPGSPLHRPVTEPSSSSLSSPRISYHWVAQCRIKQQRLDPADLNPPRPFMQHASHSKIGMPVLIYVSKNVYRSPIQLDVPVWKIVGDELAAAGAIIVTKRSEADVLVVDRRSDFYKNTIKPEIQKYKRTHQRVAERAWVEQCMALNEFLGISVGEMEGDDERAGREDSFAEESEPAVAPKKKTGRPVGKPRTEYTPEDDDLLCRYIAAHHPSGSHGSRKTYEMMVERAMEYPFVERHTAQSWHERFKKNSTVFDRRVERYVAGGIDNKLQTEAEREKEAEKTTQRAANAAQAGPSESNQVDASAEPTQASRDKGQGRTVVPPKRTLTSLLSDDEEQPQPVKTQKKGPSLVGRSARLEALGSAPPVATQATTLTTNMTAMDGVSGSGPSTEVALAEAEVRQDGPHGIFQPDLDIIPVVQADQPTWAAPVQAPNAERVTAVEAVVETTVVETAVAGTTTLLAITAEEVSGAVVTMTAAADAEPEHAPTPGASTSVATPEKSGPITVPDTSTPKAPSAVSRPETTKTPAAAPRPSAIPQTARAAVATPQRTLQTAIPNSAPPLSRPAPQAPAATQGPDTHEAPPAQRRHTPQTQSSSAAVQASIPMPTQPGHTTPSKRSRASEPVAVAPPAAHTQSHAQASSSWLRVLEEHHAATRQKNEAQVTKRRRSMETVSRPTATATRLAAPLTPIASGQASAEARTPNSAPSPNPPPAYTQEAPRPPPEILTPAQRAERVAAGKQAVQRTQEQYRQRIQAYTLKYQVRPSELMAAVAEVTKGHSSATTYWDVVDQGLRRKFGH